MEIKGFTKLTDKQKDDQYGGWAWLATAIPLFLQAIMTAVTTYKLLESDKGSVKYKGADAHWEKQNAKSTSHKKTVPKHTFYAF